MLLMMYQIFSSLLSHLPFLVQFFLQQQQQQQQPQPHEPIPMIVDSKTNVTLTLLLLPQVAKPPTPLYIVKATNQNTILKVCNGHHLSYSRCATSLSAVPPSIFANQFSKT